jgi:hypothetical protein
MAITKPCHIDRVTVTAKIDTSRKGVICATCVASTSTQYLRRGVYIFGLY